jgi:NADP-dependent 3-hydroxy acid dehydrogenase YdfG
MPALVVVTGASSGIGLATARAFAAEGHPVLAVSRHPEDADGVMTAAADVTDVAALEGAIRAAEAEHGATGCLVNDAGILDARAFTELEPADFQREIETNLIGTMNASRLVLDGMLAAGRGTIINVSSVSDRRPAPLAIGYTVSKYGVRAFGESLRLAHAADGLRVVNVAPGYVHTRILEGSGVTFEEYREAMGNPEFLSSEQLADVILWCWRQPQEVCVRDIEIAPTNTTF